MSRIIPINPASPALTASLSYSPVAVFRSAALFALVASFVFYAALTSRACAPRNVKQKAWIVTLLSSILTTATSIPFLIDFLAQACNFTPASETAFAPLTVLAHAVCGAFQGFLVADLIIGAVAYSSEVSLLTGWTHHFVYALLLPYVASRGWAPVFALCLAMEAPTAHLALARLWPEPFRNDVVHAMIFFIFRIALHVRVIVLAVSTTTRTEVFSGSWLPAILMVAAFGLHAWWFFCAVTGIRRRALAAAKTKAEAAKTTVSGLRPSLGARRRSSLSEYIIVKSRSARAHARKRAPWILAVPAAYTLMRLAIRYAPLPAALDAEF